MKKHLSILLCLLFVGILSGCAKQNNQNPDPTQAVEQSPVTAYNLYEFDPSTEQFTDNQILTINVSNAYVATDQSGLIYQDPKYYIGEFKRYYTDTTNVERTISVYEYTDTFNINRGYSYISENWAVSNNYANSTTDYIANFYKVMDDYTLVISIMNNSKKPLVLSDVLPSFELMVGESCAMPEHTSSTVEGTLNKPAKVGEWVSTRIYNRATKKYEPVCLSITNVYTGKYADKVITDFNNTHVLGVFDSNYDPTVEIHEAAGGCEWVVYEYSIYFPNSYTGTTGDFVVPITISNMGDSTTTIDGNTDLYLSVRDISEFPDKVEKGTIWSSGIGIYQMSIDYQNYLIKIAPNDGKEIKYYTIK